MPKIDPNGTARRKSAREGVMKKITVDRLKSLSDCMITTKRQYTKHSKNMVLSQEQALAKHPPMVRGYLMVQHPSPFLGFDSAALIDLTTENTTDQFDPPTFFSMGNPKFCKNLRFACF